MAGKTPSQAPSLPAIMPNYIKELVKSACEHDASDLFLSEGSIPRMKIFGIVHVCGDRYVTRDELAEFWALCRADADVDSDKDSAYVADNGTRFRVNCHKHSGKLGAVLRLIKRAVPAIGSLGLPVHVLTHWLEKTNGLMLVTGPTGAGKSTTLAACLEWINERKNYHVVTIEDPMEYEFFPNKSFFTQREVGRDTPSFASGLRSALRQAPDIIFLGEIRDAETAVTALQAAETGHLVFGSLHSATVTDALERFMHLIDQTQREGVQTLLSYQLIGILSQQLLPGTHGDESVVVCEHLDVQAAARDWIREMKLPELREFMQRKDSALNRTFTDSLVEAYQAGRISFDTAMAHSGNPYEFTRILRGIS